MSTTWAILRKDLLLELRTLETIPAMVLLAIVTFVIFHFSLSRDVLSGQLAGGVLTVSLLFAAMLGINRLFVAEREQGGFDAFLLAPVDRTAMLFAKAGALFIYLAILELIAVPAFAVLLSPPGLGAALPGLILVLAAHQPRVRCDRHVRLGDRGSDAGARPDRPGDRAAAADSRADRDRARDRIAAEQARLDLAARQVAGDPGAL